MGIISKLLSLFGSNARQQSNIADNIQQGAIVAFTDIALAKVRESQKADGRPFLRVMINQGGPGVYMYDMDFDDQVNVAEDILDLSHGIQVIVDRRSAIFLDATTIDWQRTPQGAEGFHFDNPNAVQSDG
ncbi:Iron-sulfur cluster insertion protein ErpA [Symmachiella macrocystis]|uniref:Iron-sulfur cluster insertion protein ErpA n=1 Tax=Symmachiella macrocystis TaxID=2527985 RepID=A0A5C6B7F4_9PLAN|nr:iron-sulfur cluster biosynthesis family protein [Symmachiella macrocystis]TWU07219.1 Iron-sulfur cluster insertion protein ErpA [Symmachiella macrocystis]